MSLVKITPKEQKLIKSRLIHNGDQKSKDFSNHMSGFFRKITLVYGSQQ